VERKAAASIAARVALRSTARARRWRLAPGEAIKDWRRRGLGVGLLSSSGGTCVSEGVEFISSAWRRVVGRVEVEIFACPAANSVLLRFWPFWSICQVPSPAAAAERLVVVVGPTLMEKNVLEKLGKTHKKSRRNEETK
jgi:hypothetical protein